MNSDDVKQEIKHLNNKKTCTFLNIPTKQLKETMDIICTPLKNIWNNKIFPKI